MGHRRQFDASTAHQTRLIEINPSLDVSIPLSQNWTLRSSHPSHQWRLGLAMPKSGDALTMMVNVKTDRNQAKQKAIVGIIVGIVKNNNQGMP